MVTLAGTAGGGSAGAAADSAAAAAAAAAADMMRRATRLARPRRRSISFSCPAPSPFIGLGLKRTKKMLSAPSCSWQQMAWPRADKKGQGGVSCRQVPHQAMCAARRRQQQAHCCCLCGSQGRARRGEQAAGRTASTSSTANPEHRPIWLERTSSTLLASASGVYEPAECACSSTSMGIDSLPLLSSAASTCRCVRQGEARWVLCGGAV